MRKRTPARAPGALLAAVAALALAGSASLSPTPARAGSADAQAVIEADAGIANSQINHFDSVTNPADQPLGLYGAVLLLGSPSLAASVLDVHGAYDPFLEAEGSFVNPTDEVLDVAWRAVIRTQALPGAPWTMDTSLDITLTDANGDGVSLTPADPAAPGLPSEPLLGTAIKTDDPFASFQPQLNLFVDATTVQGAGLHTFDPAAIALPDAPAGESWRFLVLGGAFKLSPFDTVDFVARVDQQMPVPEPALLGLLGVAGLAVRGGARRGGPAR